MAVVIATTSIELIFGFLVVLWQRSSDKTSRVVKQLAVPLKEEEDEFEVASGKTRVTIFSGTQTGTAEGLVDLVWISEAKQGLCQDLLGEATISWWVKFIPCS
ncbi:putative NADPH--hemoprotein reductase [Rosa chinensis]|uniref:Putative NADPH--hemoprotein reductase n=1 Tax=Rosa chinensis TaxID=74649 RepID=A0A2P6Q7G1_ROSCH|nr:putative NADPH--hemoprotein reductase [Rosa chinensis]